MNGGGHQPGCLFCWNTRRKRTEILTYQCNPSVLRVVPHSIPQSLFRASQSAILLVLCFSVPQKINLWTDHLPVC